MSRVTKAKVRLSSEFQEFAPYWDKNDTRGLILLFTIILLPLITFLPYPRVSRLPSNYPILLLSAGTVFLAQYRLRHPDKETVATVVQTFESSTEGPEIDRFGLKNYGPGAAHFLQLKVEYCDEETIVILPRDPPINLDEGEFVDLVHNEEFTGDNLSQILKSSSCDEDVLEFHYSFVSSSGIRIPLHWNGKAERDDENLLNEELRLPENPRRIEASRIRNLLD